MDLEAHDLSATPSQLRSAAVLRAAPSNFVASVNAWFDAAISRADERFALQTRLTTLAVAIAVALALQFDSIQLMNRLSVDGPLRQALVAAAAAEKQPAQPAIGDPAEPHRPGQGWSDDVSWSNDVRRATATGVSGKPSVRCADRTARRPVDRQLGAPTGLSEVAGPGTVSRAPDHRRGLLVSRAEGRDPSASVSAARGTSPARRARRTRFRAMNPRRSSAIEG